MAKAEDLVNQLHKDDVDGHLEAMESFVMVALPSALVKKLSEEACKRDMTLTEVMAAGFNQFLKEDSQTNGPIYLTEG